MRISPLRRSALLVLLTAVVLVAAAGTAATSRSGANPRFTPVGSIDRAGNGVFSPADVTEAVVAPAPKSARGADLRLLAVGVLCGLTAAAAATGVRRGLPRCPTRSPRPGRLRGDRANRAPPACSIV